MLGDWLPVLFARHTTIATTADMQEIRFLDRQCLLKCKLAAYSNRLSTNDYNDIKDLIFRFSDEVRAFKHTLDQELVDFFITHGLAEENEQDSVIQEAKRIMVIDI